MNALLRGVTRPGKAPLRVHHQLAQRHRTRRRAACPLARWGDARPPRGTPAHVRDRAATPHAPHKPPPRSAHLAPRHGAKAKQRPLPLPIKVADGAFAPAGAHEVSGTRSLTPRRSPH